VEEYHKLEVLVYEVPRKMFKSKKDKVRKQFRLLHDAKFRD